MAELAFLILNYKNVEETKKCIESIRKAQFEKWKAVIVDNGSGGDSYELLTNLYCNDSHIIVIESTENLGFSKGNNLGYAYIKKQFNPDFLVVTNNDVIFPVSDFDAQLQRIYKETAFYVYGPDIYVRFNREHQSPMMLNLPSKEELQNELSMYEYYLGHPEKWAKRRKMQTLKNRLCQSNKGIQYLYNKFRRKKTIDFGKRYENVCVQGACVIVSRDYIQKEEKMFLPEPFLYCEELLLYKKCLDKGYKIVYDPAIQVWHEDSSTMKKINKDSVQRAKFTLKHHVAARKMLLGQWK